MSWIVAGLAVNHFNPSLLYDADSVHQWRTEGGVWGGPPPPPPRNSENIGGVLDRMNKKNRRLNFLL